MEKLLTSYKTLKDQAELIDKEMKKIKKEIQNKMKDEGYDNYDNQHFMVFPTGRRSYKWDKNDEQELINKGYLFKEIKIKQTKDDKKIQEAIVLGKIQEKFTTSLTIRAKKNEK